MPFSNMEMEREREWPSSPLHAMGEGKDVGELREGTSKGEDG